MEKKRKFDALLKDIPSLTKEMLILSDLVYYKDGVVIDELNRALELHGFCHTKCVSDVIVRIHDRDTIVATRQDLTKILAKVFRCNKDDTKPLLRQWVTC